MKISVIITAHNRRNYLHSALNSVINQGLSRDFFEIIVVKNFKDDILDGMISSAGAKNILVPEETNVGFDMYRGIIESEGEVICFLDDDDVFAPNRLETIYSVFDDKSIIYFRNDLFFQDDNDKIVFKVQKLKLKKEMRIESTKIPKVAAHLDRIKAGFNLSSIAFRRNIIDQWKLDYLRERLVQSTDTFIFCCAICSKGLLILSPNELTGYRLNESTSKIKTTDPESTMKLIAFWGKLLTSYKELMHFFGKCSQNYLMGRIVNQEIAIQKLSLRSKFSVNSEFRYVNSIIWAIRSRNYLILYDLLLITKLKLTNLVYSISNFV